MIQGSNITKQMSIENEIARRLFTPVAKPAKEEPKKATVKRARVKRQLPDKDAQIVDAITKVVGDFNKKKRR